MLVDAGLSCKEIVTRLEAIGERPEALDAVLVTHEHCDHVCGLIPLLKKYKRYKLPVYTVVADSAHDCMGGFRAAARTVHGRRAAQDWRPASGYVHDSA